MTELDQMVVDKFISDGVIKFYVRYVDDILVLIKPHDVNKVLNKLNFFHKNLRFTVDTFAD